MKQSAKHPGLVIPIIVFLILIASGYRRQSHSSNIKGRIMPPAGGSILGIVVPFSIKTNILAVSVTDTVASTFSDTTNGAYILKDVPPGNYALIYVPSDNRYTKTSNRAAVSEGQITIADTIWLRK